MKIAVLFTYQCVQVMKTPLDLNGSDVCESDRSYLLYYFSAQDSIKTALDILYVCDMGLLF